MYPRKSHMRQPYAVDASRVLGRQSHHQRDEDGIQQMSMAEEQESQQVQLLGLGFRRQTQIRMHVMHGVCLQHFANVFVAMYSKMDLAAFQRGERELECDALLRHTAAHAFPIQSWKTQPRRYQKHYRTLRWDTLHRNAQRRQ